MRWPWQPLVDDTGRPGLTLAELLIVFLTGVLAFVTAAPAHGRGITVDCRELAFTIGTVVWARTNSIGSRSGGRSGIAGQPAAGL